MLTLSTESGEINKFDQHTLSELHTALSFLENSSLDGLIINSDQSTFLTGADSEEFLMRFQQSADKVQAEINSYHQALSRIEALPYPSLCAINGATLSSGVELALACDYRIAVCDAKLGSPEVSLGLIPGAGATVRLPRVVGIENALHWVGDGECVPADQCNIGLLDEICFSLAELSERTISKIQEVIQTPRDWKKRRETKKQAARNIPSTPVFERAQQRLSDIYHDDPSLLARQAAIQSIAESASSTQAIALAIESMHLIQMSQTENCKELIAAFLTRHNHETPESNSLAIKPERQRFLK